MSVLTRNEILNLPGDLVLSYLVRLGYAPKVQGDTRPDGAEFYVCTLMLADRMVLAFRGDTMQEAVRSAAVNVFDARKLPPTMTPEPPDTAA